MQTRRLNEPPVHFRSYNGICYWSRRFKVGRSSSFLSPSLDAVLWPRRNVGLLGLLASSTLWRFSIAASRDFISLNSDVVSMYWSFAGRIVAISSWDLVMRSGV